MLVRQLLLGLLSRKYGSDVIRHINEIKVVLWRTRNAVEVIQSDLATGWIAMKLLPPRVRHGEELAIPFPDDAINRATRIGTFRFNHRRWGR